MAIPVVKIKIIQHNNQYAIVEREGERYRLRIDDVIFGENPQYGYVDPRLLTAAKRVS